MERRLRPQMIEIRAGAARRHWQYATASLEEACHALPLSLRARLLLARKLGPLSFPGARDRIPVEQRIAEANHWFRRSARLGDATQCFQRGDGWQPRDRVLAGEP